MPQRSRYIVRNAFTDEELADGSFEDCQEFVAKYGGGWSSLEIAEAVPEESQDELWKEVITMVKINGFGMKEELKSKFHITRKTPNQ